MIVDNRVVPVDGKANAVLRYRGEKQTFPYLSAADVLSGGVPAGTLQDKIVFVGTTALGTREVVATPLDTLFAGVEVQATVADNLLADFITDRIRDVIEDSSCLCRRSVTWSSRARARPVRSARQPDRSGALVFRRVGASTRGVFVSPLMPTSA